MKYSDVLDFLYSSLPMYQRIGKAAYKADLSTSVSLDDYFGNPHRSFRTIHVAGTNGKGSVSHMLASVLQAAGYRTGLYTSPHLLDFRERIRVNGKMIGKDDVIDFVVDNMDMIRKLETSFFEMTVAMAFLYFKQQQVDIAVIETGMGGRLDSTNIIKPEISVITNIGLDHMQYLGNTIPEIAEEKAGIIKDKVPVVIGESDTEAAPVFIRKANEHDSDIFFADKVFSLELLKGENDVAGQLFNAYRDKKLFMQELYTDMTGNYQKMNIITVLQVAELLIAGNTLDKDSLRRGLRNVKQDTGLSGRWMIIRQSPLVICDPAHNYPGLKIVIEQLMELKKSKLHIVLGMVNDKDIDTILGLFPADAEYYFTRASIPRAMDQDLLKSRAARCSLSGDSYASVPTAYDAALQEAGQHDVIFIGGSTFVVADLLKTL
ncbi:MAG: folylpolyglutamate synthase/dihydrofolate synthase family protein [Bacteroidales bacterium]|nr:folylpolyglutamate synthase/dihydrofolate synthase family protein [Bacteroidales bacterium]